jgi:hypothetical protein
MAAMLRNIGGQLAFELSKDCYVHLPVMPGTEKLNCGLYRAILHFNSHSSPYSQQIIQILSSTEANHLNFLSHLLHL